jgi:hypothetical protein
VLLAEVAFCSLTTWTDAGKTSTIVAAVHALLTNSSRTVRILLAAPANDAVDHLVKKYAARPWIAFGDTKSLVYPRICDKTPTAAGKMARYNAISRHNPPKLPCEVRYAWFSTIVLT